jgi:dihydroneopterin aldolase
MTRDLILLEGMTFFGHHGTLPAERDLGQRFVVDVELRVDLQPAGERDDLDLTVDYSQVHDQVRALVEGPPVQLTETLAVRVAGAVLDRHPLVQAVRVRVRKPGVRLGTTVLAGSVVEVTRDR